MLKTFTKAEKKLLKSFKNGVFLLYYNEAYKYQMKAQREIEEEIEEKKKKTEREKRTTKKTR